MMSMQHGNSTSKVTRERRMNSIRSCPLTEALIEEMLSLGAVYFNVEGANPNRTKAFFLVCATRVAFEPCVSSFIASMPGTTSACKVD